MKTRSQIPSDWKNYRAVLEYDGSVFFGFQRQPNHPTIQEAFETALSKLFSQKISIGSASGRTDTGVHALGQVVHFFAPSKFQDRDLKKGLNALLPKSIAVRGLETVPKKFHARYDAKRKIYEYRIWNDLVRSPLCGKRAVHIPYALDFKAMKQAAKILTGKHDFRSFCASDPSGKEKTTVRKIFRITLSKKASLIVMTFEANGFLYHMVRNLVGTLVEVGRKKIKIQAIKTILKSKDRRSAGFTAPADGLCLVNVTY